MLLEKLEYRDSEISKSDAQIMLTYCKVMRELDSNLAHIGTLKKLIRHLADNDCQMVAYDLEMARDRCIISEARNISVADIQSQRASEVAKVQLQLASLGC